MCMTKTSLPSIVSFACVGLLLISLGTGEARAQSKEELEKIVEESGGGVLVLQAGEQRRVFPSQALTGVTEIDLSGPDLTNAAPSFAQEPELIVQTGHSGPAFPIGFSPDGRTLFTQGFRAVKMWDVASGRELRTLAQTKGANIAAKLSPDGKILVTGEDDDFLNYWDAATGQELKVPGCRYTCFSISHGPFEFSPDGKLVVARGAVGGWSLIDLRAGGSRGLFINTTREDMFGTRDTLLGFSPDGRMLAFRDDNKVIRLWDVASGEKLKLPEGPIPYDFYDIVFAFSPDGRTVATVDKDNTVRLLDIRSGEELLKRRADAGEVMSVVFSPDGNLLAVGGRRRTLLLDVATGEDMRYLPGFEVPLAIPLLRFMPDGSALMVSGKNSVKVWDIKTGSLLRNLQGQGIIMGLKLSPDGTMLGVLSAKSFAETLLPAQHTFDLWELATWKRFITPIGCASAVYSPGGATLAVGCADGSIKIFDVRADEELRVLGKHADDVVLVTLSPDGLTLASSVSGGAANNKKELIAGDFLDPLAGLNGSSVLAAGDENRQVKLWNLTGGGAPLNLRGHTGIIRAIVFSPDGRVLATASQDNTIKLWDAATGKELVTLKGHSAPVTAVAFSHDSRTLASSANDLTIKLWDVATGSEVKTLKYRTPHLTSALAFSPDDARLAAGCVKRGMHDNIKLWNVATGWEIKTLSMGRALVTSLAFTTDSKMVVARNSEDGVIKVLDIDSGTALMTFLKNDHETLRELFALAPDFYRKGDDEAVTPDGNVRIAPATSGRLNFTEARSGELLASLIALDENDWAVVASDGRFDTNKLENPQDLHWLLPNAPLAPLSLEVFMRDYFEPRLLPRLLKCSAEGNCASKFKPIRDLSALNRAQPNVRITKIKPSPSRDAVEVSVTVESVAGKHQRDAQGLPLSSGVYDLRLFRNGQLVGHSTPGTRLQETFKPYSNFEEELAAWRTAHKVGLSNDTKTITFKVKLPATAADREVEFSAYAFNNDRVKSESDRATYAVPAGANPAPRPRRAYVITFGVNSYDDPAWDLQFAANDARAVREVVSARLRARGEFSEVVEVSLVSDGATAGSRGATKANVQTVLELLAGSTPPAARLKSLEKAVGERTVQSLRPAGPEDLFLISFSSHGYADREGVFYILPSDIGKDGARAVTDELLRHSISSNDLSLWLRDVDAGEMVMIVDACHAASAVEGRGFKPGPMGSRGLGQLAFDKGMKILAATQAANTAIETGGSIGHGLLTFALVREGLENNAADFRAKDSIITLKEWLEYGEYRVPGLYNDLENGSLKGIGRAIAELVGVGRVGALGAAQRPSLFDFTRKRTEVVLARLP